MIKVEKEIIVPASIDQLFAFIANFENDTKWISSFILTEFSSSEPSGVDTVGKGISNILGRDYEASFIYDSYDPPHNVSRRMITDPLVMEMTTELKQTDSGTHVSHTQELKLKGFRKLLEPIIKKKLRKQMLSCVEELEFHFRLISLGYIERENPRFEHSEMGMMSITAIDSSEKPFYVTKSNLVTRPIRPIFDGQ